MRKNFVYLASASPRRAALLEQIGVRCRIRPSRVSESLHDGELAEAYVLRLAQAKAEAVWRDLPDSAEALVLAADTAVVLDGSILGKPGDRAEALSMLEALSGRSHHVLTGVALRFADDAQVVLSTSEVRIRNLSERERHAYCASDEPYDKAGGYAIQGLAAVFIEYLSGSYSSVMGLPLAETAALLRRHGLPAWLAGDGGRT